MPLTVLTDSDVRALLLTLNKDDVSDLQHNLADALHSYSTGDMDSGCCSSFQPPRTVIKRNGATTVFLPASSGDAVGIKIVSLATPEATVESKPSATSVASDLSGLTLTPASTMSTGSSTSGSTSGSSFQPPPSVASSQSTTPRGTLTMLDSQGRPTGVVSAEELTAFRTALAATLMFRKRSHVHVITVFGAGKQAYWHIRLALLFKGDEIRQVNIINRSMERSIGLLKSFQMCDDDHPQWRKDIKFSAVSPEFVEYGRLLKEEVRKADAIFCCTPSVEPLFPAEFLTSHEGRRKGRYISAIGSYAPHMTELHPDILRDAVALDQAHQHHKQAKRAGVIIVDSLTSCMREAGEVIQAQLTPEHLVEIGELIMVKRSVLKEIELGGPGDPGLVEWLTKGNVIYKSVGLGLMDLVVGTDLVRLARERGIGLIIPDF